MKTSLYFYLISGPWLNENILVLLVLVNNKQLDGAVESVKEWVEIYPQLRNQSSLGYSGQYSAYSI